MEEIMLIAHLTNQRSKTLWFHFQNEYRWWLIHTDASTDMMPRKRSAAMGLWVFANLETSFGKGLDNPSSGGPPRVTV
tara:strand:+ start:189 stop:422 length:234 start_codon:yes stop_codon:yes gene_type:complete